MYTVGVGEPFGSFLLPFYIHEAMVDFDNIILIKDVRYEILTQQFVISSSNPLCIPYNSNVGIYRCIDIGQCPRGGVFYIALGQIPTIPPPNLGGGGGVGLSLIDA